MSPFPQVLVVDDDPVTLGLIAFYLNRHGCSTHTASSGRKALALLEQHPETELLLCDLFMPQMDGMELLRTLRAQQQEVELPVIFLSAAEDPGHKVRGLDLGAVDFITKPFVYEELLARVRNQIRLHRLQKKLLHAEENLRAANAVLQDRNTVLANDLDAARLMQRSLIPAVLPRTKQIRMAARYCPADRLSGDFYDIVSTTDRTQLGILIADVCGHGVSAALVTGITKASFQNAWAQSHDPARVLNLMNTALCRTLQSGFVTVFLVHIDLQQGLLRYAGGGHPPMFLQRKTPPQVQRIESTGTFLGSFEGVSFPRRRIHLHPGDRLFLVTDGLHEAHHGAECYGLQRICEYLAARPRLSLPRTLDGLLRSVRSFVKGACFDDDITLLAIELT